MNTWRFESEHVNPAIALLETIYMADCLNLHGFEIVKSDRLGIEARHTDQYAVFLLELRSLIPSSVRVEKI